MIPLLVILLTSLLGFAVVWFSTGGATPDGGNAIASVLSAIGVALLWSRGFLSLERAYLTANFAKVRRKLLLWGTSLGAEETAILRLSMAIEAREKEETERALADARVLGIERFAAAWAAGLQARLKDDPRRALKTFVKGANNATGLDRAELFAEAGVLALQMTTERPLDARMAELQRAIEYANEIDRILGSGPEHPERKRRFQYVELLHRTLRALINLAQGRHEQALGQLRDVQRRTRYAPALRAKRLHVLAGIESLAAVYELEGKEAFDRAAVAARKEATLPLVRLRVRELENQIARLHARRTSEQHRAERAPDQTLFEEEPDEEPETIGADMMEGMAFGTSGSVEAPLPHGPEVETVDDPSTDAGDSDEDLDEQVNLDLT